MRFHDPQQFGPFVNHAKHQRKRSRAERLAKRKTHARKLRRQRAAIPPPRTKVRDKKGRVVGYERAHRCP